MRLTLIVLVAASPILASMGASIAGTILDPVGAAMTEVAVSARNVGTGVIHHAATNDQGFYAFPDLPIGRYSVEVEHPGFRPYTQTGLEVISNAALRVDIAMVLGGHSEALTVCEASAQVETANTQMGERITATKMSAVPVNGRSYTDLLALQPGVIPAGSQQPNTVVMSGCTSAPPSGDLNPGNLSVSGQRETTNGFTVNGTSAQDDFNMGAAVVPNLDSIREFHVLTSNFNAEYGNFSGGQVQVTTKSGTNQFHGSVFDFLRDTRLDARNYFAAERATYDRNSTSLPACPRRSIPQNPRLSRALSAFDMRHNFVASYDWKLPLAKLLRRRNALTKDWSLSGIARFDTPDCAGGNLAVNTDPTAQPR